MMNTQREQQLDVDTLVFHQGIRSSCRCANAGQSFASCLHFLSHFELVARYIAMSLDTDFVLETLHNPNREELDRYVCESKPVLIKGLVSQWPAFTNWKDPNYLIEKVGLIRLH